MVSCAVMVKENFPIFSSMGFMARPSQHPVSMPGDFSRYRRDVLGICTFDGFQVCPFTVPMPVKGR